MSNTSDSKPVTTPEATLQPSSDDVMGSYTHVMASEDGRYIRIGPHHLDKVIKVPRNLDTDGQSHFDYCIHHGPCADGLTASWAVQRICPDIKMIAQSPGCARLFQSVSLEDLTKARVVFVDICPIQDILQKVLDVCSYVLILDHHETNKDLINKIVANSVPPNLNVVFDMDRAGCHIAWDYFHYNHYDRRALPRPWFLDYVGDGDLWYPSERKTPNPLPNGRLVVKGLHECGHLESRETLQALYDCSGKRLNLAHEDKRQAIIDNQLIPMGQLAIQKADKIIASLIKYAWLTEYTAEDGTRYYAWMVNNTNYTINSSLGHQMLDRPIILNTKSGSDITEHYPGASLEGLDYKQAATLNMESNIDNETTSELIMPAFSIMIKGYDPVSNSLWLSLRGGKDYSPNVAHICARFGGGGHPAASGATVHMFEFRKWFKVIEHV